MRPIIGAALYFTLWWLALFAVLPFCVHPQEEADEVSGWHGASGRPRFWRLVVATSITAGIIWFGVWVVVREGWVPLDRGWMAPRP